MTITVVVADDQALVRGAVVTLLGLEPDLEVVGEAGRGDEAVELILCSEVDVDVALLDVEMPGMDGIEVCRSLTSAGSRTRSLIVTTFGRPGFVRRALEAGAAGFLVKDAPADQLADAVRRVHAGELVVDGALAAESLIGGANPLTPREADVLRAALSGGPIAVVAKQVHLSEGTVRNHLSSAMAKTNTSTRAEAAAFARDRGWL